jgi:hypothetical protein
MSRLNEVSLPPFSMILISSLMSLASSCSLPLNWSVIIIIIIKSEYAYQITLLAITCLTITIIIYHSASVIPPCG